MFLHFFVLASLKVHNLISSTILNLKSIRDVKKISIVYENWLLLFFTNILSKSIKGCRISLIM